MLKNTWFSSTAPGLSDQSGTFLLYEEQQKSTWSLTKPVEEHSSTKSNQGNWSVFAAASFLVSVPVFFQAPLVRQLPFLSLVMTFGWVWLSLRLSKDEKTLIWGDLLLGFSLSWLAGTIYWGWLRWEPYYHLPVEAIGLPLALWGLWRGKGMVGNLFYLGSLFGTVLTDVYFYLTSLIPYWREVMTVEPAQATFVLQRALIQVENPWGVGWALVLVGTLLSVGLWALSRRKTHWLAFSGAVLSTILVDSLFWLVAYVS
ncbi:MAG: DUF3120 domain-containing protein [Coleofasciculaceae cyanobacterium]